MGGSLPRSARLPRFVAPLVAVLIAVTFVPLALVARARATKSKRPRVHLVHDMDHQPKYKAQQPNVAFADGRAMRPRAEGAVARGELLEDDHLHRGKVDGEWATELPVPLTMELLERGRREYDVFCATCHGLTGDGRGPVAVRAEELEEGTWTPPSDYHAEPVRSRPVGHLFNSVTAGIRNMPAYGPQIPVADRWAIVAYVRALIRAQAATMDDVPEEMRGRLR